MARIVATGQTPTGSPFEGLGETGRGIADVITSRRQKKADEELRRIIANAAGDPKKVAQAIAANPNLLAESSKDGFAAAMEAAKQRKGVPLTTGTNLVDPVEGTIIAEGRKVPTPAEKEAAKAAERAPDTNLVKAGQLTPAASNSIRGATTSLFDNVTFDFLTGNVTGLEPEDAANFLSVTKLAGERLLSGQDKDINAAVTNAAEILKAQFASERGPELVNTEKALTPEQKIDLENARNAVEKGAPEDAVDELLRSKGIDPRLRKISALDKLKGVFK